MTTEEKGGTDRKAGDGGRRDAILEVAAELFASRGYDGTSMMDIARAAGLSKPGIYHHFRDKHAIFASISLATLEAMCDHADRRLDGIDDPAERLRTFMLAHGDYVERHRAMYTAAHFAFLRMTDEPARVEALRLRDRYEGCTRRILADGVAAGTFRPIDPALASRLVLSALNSLARWHKPQGPASATEAADGFFDLVLGGLRR